MMDHEIAGRRFLRIPIGSRLQCLDLGGRISTISSAPMDQEEEAYDVGMW
jgi:hypothetical protein